MRKDEMEILKQLLKESLPPERDIELRRDLWPAVLQRLETSPIQVRWWDWMLFAGATLVLCFFPWMIPALLYQF